MRGPSSEVISRIVGAISQLKIYGLKLGGGQAYDLSRDEAVVVP
jgi:hypothetical protein